MRQNRELLYYPEMEIINPEVNLEKTLLKTIDILGKEVENIPYKILIDLYDDGSTQKRIILE
mgnify:FL=1